MIAARLRAPCLALVFAAACSADDGPSKTNHPVPAAENAGGSGSSRPWWEDAATSWKPALGAPPECSYRVANDPAKVAPRLDWKDCPGVVGCKLFQPGGPTDVKLAVTGHARRGPSGYELAVQLTHYPVQTAVLYDSS